jgi:uncharacterized membrane protein
MIMVLQTVASLVLTFIPLLGDVARILLAGPFTGGLLYYFLLRVRDQPAKLEDAFAGFVQPRFLKLMLTGFLMVAIQVAVVLILLIPVIIAVGGIAALGDGADSVAAFSPFLILWGLLAIIPMVFLLVIWYPTYMVVVDTGVSFWDAMEFSRKIVMMRFWSWLLFLLVCAAIGLLGMMVFCVGLLVAIPVLAGAYAKVWDDIVRASRNPA